MAAKNLQAEVIMMMMTMIRELYGGILVMCD